MGACFIRISNTICKQHDTHYYVTVITQMISYHMFNILLLRNKLCALHTQGKAMRP